MGREIKFTQSVREALELSLEKDSSVFIIGEGVPDPKGIFGTTTGLRDRFGDERILDMPIAENGMTGICVGAALMGMRPILIHQRIDFALLAIDQLANNAAKWHYMFGGEQKVPMVVRMIIGRGWGQGPQHSQNLQALFAHIPGLKVVMPSTPYDAKGLMISAVRDNNPVVYIEHRWLHNLAGDVPEEDYEVRIGSAKVARKGSDITIASTSYMTIESLRAAQILEKAGISAEVVDVRSLKPFDQETVLKSVGKTGRLLAADSGYLTGGFAAEITARAAESGFMSLKSAPSRVTLPDLPTPTSKGLTAHYYPTYVTIMEKAMESMGKSKKQVEDFIRANSLEKDRLSSDVPDSSFTGPF